MSSLLRPRRALTVAALTAVWCGLWGSASIANIASGLVVTSAVLTAGVGTTGRGGVRPVPLVKLGWLVLVDLVKSTVSVAAEIATPGDGTDEAIVAVTVSPESRDHLLLLAVAITLTPGTAVVDADADTGVLYLHLLHHDRRAATEAHVHDLARLACEALPIRSGPTRSGPPQNTGVVT